MKSVTHIEAFQTRCCEHLQRAAKPRGDWQCGIEAEFFGYDAAHDFARLNPAQVQAVLRQIAVLSNSKNFIYDDKTLIEIGDEKNNRVTVEPGGQIEFSDAPKRNLPELERALCSRRAQLAEVAAQENFRFLAVGFDPLCKLEAQNWYPKRRYAIMRPYLEKRGARARDMMTRTCAAQISLDYGDEIDLAKKYIVGNRLAPVVTAIFADSPFADGRISGYKSTRYAAWLETDAARALAAPLTLTDYELQAAHCGLKDFVDYSFDVPMIFARGNGGYSALPDNFSFGDFLCQDLSESHFDSSPTIADWMLHLSTIFTDARLKTYVELRSADCNDLEMTMALAALWKGIFYDSAALDEALRLAPALTHQEAFELRACVTRYALAARSAGVDVLNLAKEIIALAREGLGRIAPDETHYLDILQTRVVDEEICPADILLRNYETLWHGSMPKVFDYLRVA
jgi:glutamate--cysteine ligase